MQSAPEALAGSSPTFSFGCHRPGEEGIRGTLAGPLGQAKGDGGVSEALRPRRGGRTHGHTALAPPRVLLMSWADREAEKPALEPACLGLTLARCSLVLCPSTGCFISPGLSVLLCESDSNNSLVPGT